MTALFNPHVIFWLATAVSVIVAIDEQINGMTDWGPRVLIICCVVMFYCASFL
jgi:threonine/homoserine/homoserine lactone efflux protein